MVKKTMYAKKTRFITWSDDHFFISGLKSLHSEWRFIESRRFPSEKKMRSALKKKSENSIFIVKVNMENIHFFSKILGFLLVNDILTVCFIDVPVKVRPNPKGSVFFLSSKTEVSEVVNFINDVKTNRADKRHVREKMFLWQRFTADEVSIMRSMINDGMDINRVSKVLLMNSKTVYRKRNNALYKAGLSNLNDLSMLLFKFLWLSDKALNHH
ncbi:hypothetical protein ABQ333_12665 [Serratia fonticola]|uniref:hypothetical protein n=1 Tax=Serratia fonticola TaxID=47917 RepID=UPI003AAFD21A